MHFFLRKRFFYNYLFLILMLILLYTVKEISNIVFQKVNIMSQWLEKCIQLKYKPSVWKSLLKYNICFHSRVSRIMLRQSRYNLLLLYANMNQIPIFFTIILAIWKNYLRLYSIFLIIFLLFSNKFVDVCQ